MMRLIRLTFACVFLLASTPAFSSEGDVADVAEWIEEHVPSMMRKARMPGFAIAIVQDGETIYAQGFGARDLENGLPATPDTLFGIGSITKSFVAIAILQLAEQGKLDIDDPVSKHIPFELGQPDAPIRIRHFLTHSPGFPSLATSSILLNRGLGEDVGVPMASADDFFRFVNGAKDEIEFAPAEHFFYNNAAWRMLGAIVQEVSGVPFHEYVTDNVIRPLGMQRTTFDTDRLFSDSDHLVPYRRTDDGPQPTPFPYANPADNPGFSFLSAAGGIASSVNEMTAYLEMLIGQGAYEGGRLIDSRTMRAMQSLQMHDPDGYYGADGYGYGLRIVPDFLGEKLVRHGGSIIVSTAHMAVVPARRIGVVMMGNSGGMDYAAIAEPVLAILMGHDPDEVIPSIGIRKRMQRLTGHYATYEDIESVEVIEQRGMLYMKRGETLTPLIPEDPSYRGTMHYVLDEGLKAPVEFRDRSDGSLTMLYGRYAYRKKPGSNGN